MSELTFRLRGLTERQVDEHRPDRTLRASTRLVLTTIAIVAVVYSDQIHKAIAVIDRNVDVVLTALILVGGADRVAELLKVPGTRSGEKAVERPVQVSCTLVLEDASVRKVVTPGGQ
jgi:hypothetical protein